MYSRILLLLAVIALILFFDNLTSSHLLVRATDVDSSRFAQDRDIQDFVCYPTDIQDGSDTFANIEAKFQHKI